MPLETIASQFHLPLTYATYNLFLNRLRMPIPVVERSKAWAYGLSLAGIGGSNPAGDMDICLVWVLCVVS
jgi:hypothetical protein